MSIFFKTFSFASLLKSSCCVLTSACRKSLVLSTLSYRSQLLRDDDDDGDDDVGCVVGDRVVDVGVLHSFG